MRAALFETQRLGAFALTADDQALYVALYTDPERLRFLLEALTHAQAARSFSGALAAASDPSNGTQWLVLKHAGASIGLCGITEWSAASQIAEVGILLLKSAQHQGFGVEGLRGTADWAFSALPANRVEVRYLRVNAAAHAMVERVGFLRDDLARIKDTCVAYFDRRRSGATVFSH